MKEPHLVYAAGPKREDTSVKSPNAVWSDERCEHHKQLTEVHVSACVCVCVCVCVCRSSELGLFVQMPALQAVWSYSGLKGIIPAVLLHSLMGYPFFIPDAVGTDFSHSSSRLRELVPNFPLRAKDQIGHL